MGEGDAWSCGLEALSGAIIAEATLAGDVHWLVCLTGASTDAVTRPLRGITSAAPLGDGSLIAVGYYQGAMYRSTALDAGIDVVAAGEGDAIALRIGADGAVLWVLRLGAATSLARTAIVDEDGSIIVAGLYDGALTLIDRGGMTWTLPEAGHEIFLMRLDAGGNVLALERGGGPLLDYRLGGAARLVDGRIVLVGASSSPVAFPGGAIDGGGFAAIYDAQFHKTAVQILGDAVLHIVADPRGGFTVAGTFSDSLQVAPGVAPVSSRGGVDAFLLHFGADDRPDAIARFGGPGNDYTSRLTVDGDGHVAIGFSFNAGPFDGGPPYDLEADVDDYVPLRGVDSDEAAWMHLQLP